MKLRVIADSDTRYLGSIEARIGMTITDDRKITKVNTKSIVVEGKQAYSKENLTDASVWYMDAIRYGFEEKLSIVIEGMAAKERRFKEGEWWYVEKCDFVDPLILQNHIVKAGWELAKAVQTLRELALKGL